MYKPVAVFKFCNVWIAHDEVWHKVWLDNSCSALQDLNHRLLVGNQLFRSQPWGFKMQRRRH